MPRHTRYDAVIVGGGHNGLVAAAYLARAGRTVLVLERLPQPGGAAVSTRAFDGVDARLSRYSYLVSLLPRKIVTDLGLRFAVRRRTISSYTPRGSGGLLVDAADPDRTRDSFTRLTGSDREFEAWQRFYAMTGHVARQVFPTLTEPLPTRAELERRVGDTAAWETLFERPLGEAIDSTVKLAPSLRRPVRSHWSALTASKLAATTFPAATTSRATTAGSCWSYRSARAVASWSQLGKSGSSLSSIRWSRSSYFRKTSRTWR